MAIVVSFIRATPQYSASGVNDVRIRENLAPNGTTTATAQEGEFVVIGNAETSMIAAAWGSTPDAAAVASSATTTAGMPIAAGDISLPIYPKVGDKINVKTVS